MSASSHFPVDRRCPDPGEPRAADYHGRRGNARNWRLSVMTHVGESLESERTGVSRRNVLRAGAVGVAAVGLGAGKVLMQPSLQTRGLLSKDGLFEAGSIAFADALYD